MPSQVLPVTQNQFALICGNPGQLDARRATSRFSLDGKLIFHMGTSTFSATTPWRLKSHWLRSARTPFDKVCYIGCGVPPAEAVMKNAQRQFINFVTVAAS
jgi:Zn-dependent alcohol dehydrogenase